MLKGGIVVFFYVDNIVFCYERQIRRKLKKQLRN